MNVDGLFEAARATDQSGGRGWHFPPAKPRKGVVKTMLSWFARPTEGGR